MYKIHLQQTCAVAENKSSQMYSMYRSNILASHQKALHVIDNQQTHSYTPDLSKMPHKMCHKGPLQRKEKH